MGVDTSVALVGQVQQVRRSVRVIPAAESEVGGESGGRLDTTEAGEEERGGGEGGDERKKKKKKELHIDEKLNEDGKTKVGTLKYDE